LDQDRGKWAVVNAVMNFEVLYSAGNFLKYIIILIEFNSSFHAQGYAPIKTVVAAVVAPSPLDACTYYSNTIFFSGEGPRSRRYGRTAALRLLVQSCDEDDDDDDYFLSFS
jgi:hypothetical protein